MRIPFTLLCVLFFTVLHAAPETRVHSFGNAPADLVERQIRMLVPEKQRVSMNAAGGQVIVVGEPEVQERVAAMLRELSRPPTFLRLWIRHNQDVREMELRDGVPLNLPVSKSPPADVVRRGRGRLPPGRRELPIVGTVLQAHVKLLREDPPVARMRVVPTLLFGKEPPYDVVRFSRLQTDVLVNTLEYVDLPRTLSTHNFFNEFLQTQPHPGHAAKPVALLVSLRGLITGGEADGPAPEPEGGP